MAFKIRNILSIVVGGFALVQSFLLYRAGYRSWQIWAELAAGAVLLSMGLWRLLRKPVDPTAALLK